MAPSSMSTTSTIRIVNIVSPSQNPKSGSGRNSIRAMTNARVHYSTLVTGHGALSLAHAIHQSVSSRVLHSGVGPWPGAVAVRRAQERGAHLDRDRRAGRRRDGN